MIQNRRPIPCELPRRRQTLTSLPVLILRSITSARTTIVADRTTQRTAASGVSWWSITQLHRHASRSWSLGVISGELRLRAGTAHVLLVRRGVTAPVITAVRLPVAARLLAIWFVWGIVHRLSTRSRPGVLTIWIG